MTSATAEAQRALRLPTAALQQGLAIVSKFLPDRPPLRVLAGVMLATERDGLHLRVFDYENSVDVRLDAAGFPKVSTVVSGKLLRDLVRGHDKKGETTISFGPTVTVGQAATSATLTPWPVDTYPQLPTAPPPRVFVTGAELHDAVKRVAPFASTERYLPVFTTIRVQPEGDDLVLTATDKYRVGEFRLPVTGIRAVKDPGFHLLVPAKALAAMTQVLRREARVGISWGNECLALHGERVTFIARTMLGQFPALDIWPTDIAATATVDRAELLQAIKAVSVVAIMLTLTVTDGRLEVSSGAETDDAPHGSWWLACPTTGTHEARFNPKFLRSLLEAQPEDRVTLAFPARSKDPLMVADGPFRSVLMTAKSGVRR